MTVIFTLLALCALFLIRNEIAYRAIKRRIDAVHAANVQSINQDAPSQVTRGRWDEFDRSTSQGAMIFDLRRWTYQQFYPEDV